MKYILSIILTLSISAIEGQVTIELSDYHKYGNEYFRTSTNQNLSDIDLASTVGPNQVWDFSNLIGETFDTLKILKADLTPFYTSFPTANLGLTSGGSNFFYEKINETGVTILGKVVRDEFNDVDNIYTYNSDGPSFVFPLQYEDSYSFNWTYSIQYPAFFPGSDSIRIRNSSQFQLSADAWGQLTLPIGTYDVLRVKQIAFSQDTVNVYNSPGPWANDIIYTDTIISWSFYTKNIGSRLFSFTQLINGFGRQASWLNGFLIDDTSIQKTELSIASIYPQPCSDKLFIDMEVNADFLIVDLTGKALIKGKLGKGLNSISIFDLAPGVYLLQTTNEPGLRPSVRKVIVGS